jgi:adenylate cyclase class 2
VIEVEIKVKIDNPSSIRSNLEKLGCIYFDNQIQSDTYYNAGDNSRDFARTDEALRIRRIGEISFITYKGPKLHTLSKSRKEIEIEIKDPTGAYGILTALGFTQVMTVIKSRDIYRLDQYEISLDTVKGLGDFLEIETTAEFESEVPSKVDSLFGLLGELGIKQEDTITKSYLELLLLKNGKMRRS